MSVEMEGTLVFNKFISLGRALTDTEWWTGGLLFLKMFPIYGFSFHEAYKSQFSVDEIGVKNPAYKPCLNRQKFNICKFVKSLKFYDMFQNIVF